MVSVELKKLSGTFSSHLRELIDSRAITIKDAGDACGIPNPTMNRYLNENRLPQLDKVVAIAEYFGVSIDWLVGLSDDKYNDEYKSREILYNLAAPEDKAAIDAILSKYK